MSTIPFDGPEVNITFDRTLTTTQLEFVPLG